VILGLHTKQLTERGTEVALLDYAAGAADLLGHEVRIFVPARAEIVEPVRQRVTARFELVLYDEPRSIACDALYVIKRGLPGRVTEHLPELNHAFIDSSHPHGHRFATVSDWASRRSVHEVRLPRGRMLRLPRVKKPPVVPHVVTLPELSEDLRETLGIPPEAIVFGRHGGCDTFSLEFVQAAVRDAVVAREDIWFLLVNTIPFADHPRVVHLPLTVDRAEIRRFINSCDYMVHAVAFGETFGLAVAEFAYVGIPVMTYVDAPRLAHLDLLSDELLLPYRNYEDVVRDLTTLPRRALRTATDLRERYSPERVMRRFDEVFLR
jgi:glycosyltransferase involved in cell wall biosynthesis